MKKSIIACCVSLAILTTTGCDVVVPTTVNSSEALTRFVDKDNGVVCYQRDMKTLSCVKVSEVAK